ncbi:hypothetical protein C9994_03795 [Marivirga lumbricoides]|uniref:Uncharacterized protein n=1 Tax=Marivirga lumbricoides TaxID=1046115 RepID=A0A2T4DU07_9BACT|nr:hypothetical protein C9994_03795 [Marivirga lumbricoides]
MLKMQIPEALQTVFCDHLFHVNKIGFFSPHGIAQLPVHLKTSSVALDIHARLVCSRFMAISLIAL